MNKGGDHGLYSLHADEAVKLILPYFKLVHSEAFQKCRNAKTALLVTLHPSHYAPTASHRSMPKVQKSLPAEVP
jgi:hypothetical protein